MKTLRRLYYRIFKRYRRIDFMVTDYHTANDLLALSEGKPDCEQWRIAPEEDANRIIGIVHIERRERIT